MIMLTHVPLNGFGHSVQGKGEPMDINITQILHRLSFFELIETLVYIYSRT